jgi:hypothetical protein
MSERIVDCPLCGELHSGVCRPTKTLILNPSYHSVSKAKPVAPPPGHSPRVGPATYDMARDDSPYHPAPPSWEVAQPHSSVSQEPWTPSDARIPFGPSDEVSFDMTHKSRITQQPIVSANIKCLVEMGSRSSMWNRMDIPREYRRDRLSQADEQHNQGVVSRSNAPLCELCDTRHLGMCEAKKQAEQQQRDRSIFP